MIYWAALGIFFKAGNWSMGFIFLAKGDTKWFFWNQIISVAYGLVLNILGYKFYGLEGLGISFLIGFILAFIQNIIVTKILFSFKFENMFFRVFGLSFIIAAAGFMISYFLDGILMYSLGIIIIAISIVHSYIELNKRIAIAEIITTLKDKYLKK